jgi:hypothetical protein
MLIQVFGISTTGSINVCIGDVLEKLNYPDQTLCVGENQSNDIETVTAHDFRPKFIAKFKAWLWIKYARSKY